MNRKLHRRLTTSRTLGFTLIELLVSMVILIGLVGLLSAAFNSASKAWLQQERTVDQFQAARTALDLLSRDLSQACVSWSVPFYANSNSVAFVAPVNDDPRAVDLAEVVYRLNWDDTTLPAAERNIPPLKLYRRFTKSTDSSGNPGNPRWDFYNNNDWPVSVDQSNVVCDGVISFTLHCYRTNGVVAVGPGPTDYYWNSTPTGGHWTEPVAGTIVNQPGDGLMTNMPPAYIDVQLQVVDAKTTVQLAALRGKPGAWTNLMQQTSRTFQMFVKIPRR
jgi:prepilin-type N-terminal cleavage/methylation domain-containing protein